MRLQVSLTVFKRRLSTFICICEGDGCIYISPFFVKKEKDVENVGSVAQSEKSPEKSQQKVFRNDYTAYTDYISKWGNFATPTGFEKEFAFYLDNLTLLSELLATHETEELIAD